MNEIYYIAGLDLGGTDIKHGSGDLTGKPLTDTSQIVKLASRVKEGPEATLEQFDLALAEISRRSCGEMVAIGLATAGPATREGIIERSTNYGELWTDCAIRTLVTQRYGVPTSYENDANAAILAEYHFLKEQQPRFSGVAGVLFTIGTGLGGGVINSSGELDRGAFGLGAELGHLPIRSPITSVNLEQQGITCGCGSIGCAEQYTTLSFIEREVQALLGNEPTHPLRQYQDPREAAKRVLSLAIDGDPFSLSIIDRQAANLGKFMADQIVAYDPAWALIGGGVTEASDALRQRYLNTVLSHAENRLGTRRMERVHVDYAALGDNAGWVGATISAAELLRSL